MLTVGNLAPGFELAAVDGERYALDRQLTLMVFFKTSCPTCQYAWPFYERLYQAYRTSGLQVWGISQHDAPKTREFQARFGASFPHLIDVGWQVSRRYDPEFVPTGFLVAPSREIVQTFVSWNSEQLNRLSKDIASRFNAPARVVVRPEDQAVVFKPG